MEIKPGDHVRFFAYSMWHYGEVTIVREEDKTAKVLFNSDSELDYWYYPIDQLEIVRPEDIKDDLSDS